MNAGKLRGKDADRLPGRDEEEAGDVGQKRRGENEGRDDDDDEGGGVGSGVASATKTKPTSCELNAFDSKVLENTALGERKRRRRKITAML